MAKKDDPKYAADERGVKAAALYAVRHYERELGGVSEQHVKAWLEAASDSVADIHLRGGEMSDADKALAYDRAQYKIAAAILGVELILKNHAQGGVAGS